MGKVVKFEPITVLSALAAVTTHIGLVGTVSSTFHDPYILARQFASMDQISGGRAGWNLVTSNNEAEALNHSRDHHLAHADRYDRAIEFAAVVQGLWESWDEDAFIRDQASGIFYDPAKVHPLHHKGRHFSVRGPLNVARSPQGRPVLVQAGASDTGRDVAAQTAEVVFTAQTTFEQAHEFYTDVMARLPRFGRSPGDLCILPGLYPVVAATQMEAEDKFDRLQNLIEPSVGLAGLANAIGVPGLERYDLDGPVPDMPVTNGPRSRQALLLEAARRDNLTLRQLCLLNAGPRGHVMVIGTPAQTADLMEHWFTERACDGFVIAGTHMPGSFEDFVRFVVPELQKRGLYRTEYAGPTLRENLGLPVPEIGAWRLP
jgi:FMN-dependent oxidoreductase (nitrilotriacetate monooxygenase family)